jgi:2-polyprenyl-6-methoxyphenol hydroxylase-like FAD-dependent oxidoreductase
LPTVPTNSPSAPDIDVLVVGAGPTGLALAAQLRAYGVALRIVDRNADRVHESRALAVQPRTLEVLAGLGLTDLLLERGNRAVQLRMHFPDRVLSVPLFDLGLADTAYPFLLFLSQAETERVFGEHLTARGVVLERTVQLTDLRSDADAVRCVLRHGDGREEVVSARYVVGCDGAHSTVRELTGIPFKGAAYPQTFVLADVEADGVEPGAAHAFLSGHGMLFFFPLGGPATWRVLAMRPRGAAAAADQPVDLDEVQRLVDTYAATKVRLRDPAWLANFRLHNRGAERYRNERIFLAGDAAHIHSPAGAQGMNTGIQDAVNLGWKLAAVTAGLADPALLDTYEPERAPIGRRVLRFTDRAFTVATSTAAVLRFARTKVAPRLVPLALRAKGGRAYLFRTISQLAIEYRRSPLSQNGPHAGRGRPRAGERLPDGAVDRDGRRSTLHAVTGTTGWHLLLCGSAQSWPEDVASRVRQRCGDLVAVSFLTGPGSGSPTPAPDGTAALADPDGRLLRRLGVWRGYRIQILVRPDGHIGYRGGGPDIAGLLRYLDRWLPGGRAG